MAETYPYKGQRVTVRARKTSSNPDRWKPEYVITGVVHIMNPSDQYPLEYFGTEAEAIAYAKEAAEWTIDHPTRTSKKKDRRLT